MANFTIASKYGTVPRNTWTGVEKIPLDVSGFDGVGLASTLKTYVNTDVALAAQVRTRLVADTTYYVATTGNDTTGTGAVGAPWLTAQKAWDWVCNNIDLQGHKVIIQFAAGTYTKTVPDQGVYLDLSQNNILSSGGYAGSFNGQIEFKGQSDRTLVKWYNDSLIWANMIKPGVQQNVGFTRIQLLTNTDITNLYGSLVAGDGIGSYYSFDSCDVRGCGSHLFFAGDNMEIWMQGSWSMLGDSWGTLAFAGLNATIVVSGHISIPAPISYTLDGFSGIFQAGSSGRIIFQPQSITGAANLSGQKYLISEGGRIANFATAATSSLLSDLPGSTPGVVESLAFADGGISSVLKSYLVGIMSKAGGGLPAAADVERTGWTLWKNTTDGKVYLVVNDGGTIKKVELV